MLKLAARALSPGGRRARLSVLFFHRVLAAPDPLAPWEPTAERFDTIVRWVKAQFNVLDLAEAAQRLHEGRLPAAAAAITFDDGYRDNHELALPVLQRHAVPATFFVASAYLDGGLMWNDAVRESIRSTALDRFDAEMFGLGLLPLTSVGERRAAADALIGRLKYLPHAEREEAVSTLTRRLGAPPPRDLMMSRDALRACARAGVRIGAHTASHPILARLDDAEAEREMRSGRDALEATVDARIGLFAYPNGRRGKDYDARHVEMARRLGFDAAFSTEPGAGGAHDNRHDLPRFTPWDRTAWRFHLRMMRNLRVL